MQEAIFKYNGVEYIPVPPEAFYEDEDENEVAGCQGCLLVSKPFSMCFASQEIHNCVEHQIIWKEKVNA